MVSRVGTVEGAHKGEPFGPFWEEIFQESLGVATSCAAALESYANELYFEGGVLVNKLTPTAAGELYEPVDKLSILKKYSVALATIKDKPLDFSSSPVQDVHVLIQTRNAIVHFRSEWFGEQGEHLKLSKKLQHKFVPSEFLKNEPVFPRAWASHSFAKWALRSTVQFIDDFHNEAGLKGPLAPFKTRIALLSGEPYCGAREQ
jgi:hypothetical protein